MATSAANGGRIILSSLLLPRLLPSNSFLLLCDMQEKFRATVFHFPAVVEVSRRMLQAARALQIPALATEQYPQGLGHSVPELGLNRGGRGGGRADDVAAPPEMGEVAVIEKTCFSMCTQSVLDRLVGMQQQRSSILLCGIEAHACIYQTTLDLIERGFVVHLVVDAISSRNPVDRQFALRALERQGALLTTSECVLLELLRDSKHPKFKEIQKLIAEPAPDSGLLALKL